MFHAEQGKKKINKDKEKSFKLIAFCFFIFFIYLVLSPFYTLSAMYFTVVNSNEAALSKYVDFPILRKNLEGQFTGAIDQVSDGWLDTDPFAVAGVGFSSGIAQSIANGVATPEYLMRMLRKEPSSNKLGTIEQLKSISTDNVEFVSRNQLGDTNFVLPKAFSSFRYSYDSFNQFSTWLRRDGRNIRFIFVRKGFGWKMTDMDIPMHG